MIAVLALHALSLLATTPAPVAATGEIAWFKGTLAEALSAAKDQGKPLIVDFYATWCAPCLELEKSVLRTAEAASATKAYLLVKVDGEAGEGAEAKRKYHVVGYPTLLFLHPDGTEIDRIFELPTLATFVQDATGFLEGKGTLEDLEKQFASRAGDFELAHEIGFREAVRGNEQRAKAYFELVDAAHRGLKSGGKLPVPPEGAKAEQIREMNNLQQQALARIEELKAEGIYALARYDYLRGSQDYNKARITLMELRTKYPKSQVSKRALYDLALAYHGLKDDKQTRATLDKYLAENKNDPKTANAYAWFCFKEGFQVDRGIEVAQAALKADDKDDSLWETLGELYAAKGDKAKAVEAADKALSIKPDDAYYKQQREKFANR